jgi:hypothetical protein
MNTTGHNKFIPAALSVGISITLCRRERANVSPFFFACAVAGLQKGGRQLDFQ